MCGRDPWSLYVILFCALALTIGIIVMGKRRQNGGGTDSCEEVVPPHNVSNCTLQDVPLDPDSGQNVTAPLDPAASSLDWCCPNEDGNVMVYHVSRQAPCNPNLLIALHDHTTSANTWFHGGTVSAAAGAGFDVVLPEMPGFVNSRTHGSAGVTFLSRLVQSSQPGNLTYLSVLLVTSDSLPHAAHFVHSGETQLRGVVLDVVTEGARLLTWLRDVMEVLSQEVEVLLIVGGGVKLPHNGGDFSGGWSGGWSGGSSGESGLEPLCGDIISHDGDTPLYVDTPRVFNHHLQKFLQRIHVATT